MFRFYFDCAEWEPTAEQWIEGSRSISESEMKRINQFVFQRDAKFALIGQLLIRYILSKAFNEPSSKFEIKRTERRRPFIESNIPFDFNVSHHHGLVFIGGTFNGRIGCDTMEYRINKDRNETIESTVNCLRSEFSDGEIDFILNQSPVESIRFERFHRIWSLKESYVKYLGTGIEKSLSILDFHVDNDVFDGVVSSTKLFSNGAETDERIRFDEQIISLSNGEQQIVVVCSEKTNPVGSFEKLSIEQILANISPLEKEKNDGSQIWNNFLRQKSLSSNWKS